MLIARHWSAGQTKPCPSGMMECPRKLAKPHNLTANASEIRSIVDNPVVIFSKGPLVNLPLFFSPISCFHNSLDKKKCQRVYEPQK